MTMMFSVARQTVRSTWRAYLGAVVALTFGVVLIALTVTLLGSVDATAGQAGVTAAQRAQLDDLTSMFGIMSGVSLFMAVFVVASTFGFVVATRRRELGLLRLVGATPRQVRRLLLAESVVVATAATVTGAVVGTLLTPLTLWAVRAIGITDLHLHAPAPWLAWAIAVPAGAVVALVGVWRSSRRAAKTPPAAALREASVQRTRPSMVQILVATVCLGAFVAAIVFSTQVAPLFALVASILLPEVVVIGLVCVGPAVIPRLAALLARPFVGRHVSARLGRDELRAGVRTTAAVAAPILAISAIAGSMLVALSFTVDWTSTQSRARLAAPLVVEAGSPAAIRSVSADPMVSVADVRREATLPLGDSGREQVELVDVATATAARGLHAERGTLDDFHGPVIAVSRSWVTDSGTNLGGSVRTRIDGHPMKLRVVAVVHDAPDLYGDLLVPAGLVPGKTTGTVFVVPRDGDTPAATRHSLAQSLAGTDSQILSASRWIDTTAAATRRANNLGLTILLGPAALYAAIAIVNATLIGASQRRDQHRLVALLGATPDQVRRAAVWQATFTTGAALLLGGMVTGILGWLIRRAITADLAGTGVAVPITIPWLPLLAIGVVSVLLAGLAAAIGTRTRAG